MAALSPGRGRLRLLYLQPAVEVGGAERQASLVLPALPAHGVDPVAVAGPGRAITAWFRDAGVPAFAWSPHFPRGGGPSLTGAASVLRDLRGLLGELEALHRQAPFDVVLGSLGYGWTAAGLVARRWGVPAVWRAGGVAMGRPRDVRPVERQAVRLLTRLLRPSLLLCNAEAVRDWWSPLVPVAAAVLPNAVEVPATVTRLVRRIDEPVRLGFLGRLAPEKGLPVLLEACARLRRQGVRFRLRIAGPGRAAPVLSLMRRLGLEREVALGGRVDDLARFHAACDLLVLPSLREGSANVLAEALARAVPVVASRVGGTPELVREGVDGLLVTAGDPRALAQAIAWMAEHPEQARAMGLAGRERMRAFGPDAVAARLAALLREQVARRYGSPGGSGSRNEPSACDTARPTRRVPPAVTT